MENAPAPDGPWRWAAALPDNRTGWVRKAALRWIYPSTNSRKKICGRPSRRCEASEERFRALVQFSFDVYWETDAQHRFTRQEFAEDIANAPARGSEIGKTRWEVSYVEPDEGAWRDLRATLDAHLPFRDFELARPTADGGRRYVSVCGLPVFDETGRFIGCRGVGRDITTRKCAEQEHRAHLWFLESMDRSTGRCRGPSAIRCPFRRDFLDERGHTAARNLAKIRLGSRCTVHGRAAGEP
jgi:PAS domain-containing protein